MPGFQGFLIVDKISLNFAFVRRLFFPHFVPIPVPTAAEHTYPFSITQPDKSLVYADISILSLSATNAINSPLVGLSFLEYTEYPKI